jgi:hypothetical protein
MHIRCRRLLVSCVTLVIDHVSPRPCLVATQVYLVVWSGKGGPQLRSGLHNYWNLAQFSVPSALKCMESKSSDPAHWPLLGWNTLSALMNYDWWFDMKTLANKKVQGHAQEQRKAIREQELEKKRKSPDFVWPFFTLSARTNLSSTQAEQCKCLLTAWANEGHNIELGASSFTFALNGDMELAER